jgi:hypothetical protein
MDYPCPQQRPMCEEPGPGAPPPTAHQRAGPFRRMFSGHTMIEHSPARCADRAPHSTGMGVLCHVGGAYVRLVTLLHRPSA